MSGRSQNADSSRSESEFDEQIEGFGLAPNSAKDILNKNVEAMKSSSKVATVNIET